ncbi:MAG: NUDIX domain-containing protein [Candidatus Paceibacterota bacterium]|jgi:8-oxo-dGTP pyrophosphatase MutT (NUDIX family)
MKKGIDYIGIAIGYVCHDGNGNYLMNKRSVNCRDEHGTWDFGGGGLEVGEEIECCLKKEIKEEYGVEPISYSFLGYIDNFRNLDGVDTHWICLEFLVQIDPLKVINGEPHKFEELKWFKINNLPRPLHSIAPKILEKFKDKLL